MEKSYRNLGLVLLLFIPLTFLGFFPTYFSKFPSFENTPIFNHIHAVVASSWILLLIVQPLLIRQRKYVLHKGLGRLSFFLFPLLIITFVPQMINVVERGEYEILLFPVMDIILLTLFYAMAIRNRSNTAVHMRYMIANSLVFLSPTVGRLLYGLMGFTNPNTSHIAFLIIESLLIVLVLWDRSNRKNYHPYLVALAGFVVYQLLYVLIFTA